MGKPADKSSKRKSLLQYLINWFVVRAIFWSFSKNQEQQKNTNKHKNEMDKFLKRARSSNEPNDAEAPPAKKTKLQASPLTRVSIINNEQACVNYTRGFVPFSEANTMYNNLKNSIAWAQFEITVVGRKVLQPRMSASFGDVHTSYRYSGIRSVASDWPDDLKKLRDMVQSFTGETFNFALVNYYRDGKDYIGAHADKEQDLVAGSSIASVSLGAQRDFVLTHLHSNWKRTVLLENGSLLVMGGNCQKNYKHAVPKRANCKSGRINITFRLVKYGK